MDTFWLSSRIRAVIGFLALLGAALTSGTVIAAAGHRLALLEYVAGPNWKPGGGPGDQDLQTHFDYVTALSRDGKVIGNGMIESKGPQGFYLLDVASASEGEQIVHNDPAIDNGVLKKHRLLTWLVLMDGFDHANKAKGEFFVLDYGHGPSWVEGLSLMEQDVAQHLSYIQGLFAAGRLIGGGPVLEEDRGMYLVKTPHRAMARGIVAADPAVRSGVFDVKIRRWSPGSLRPLK